MRLDQQAEWTSNATYKNDFKRMSEKVEKKYDLSAWASSLNTIVNCESSLVVERTLEKSMLSSINTIGTLNEVRNLITSESENISRMSSHFWPNEGEIVVWKALDLAQEIIAAIDRTSSEMSKANSTSEMAQKYNDDWWKIDNDYRVFRLQTDTNNKLQTLSKYIRTVYRDYQNQLNEKFLNIIVKQGSLSIKGIPSQSEFWKKVASSKKRHAVILVDALRFELGQDLVID